VKDVAVIVVVIALDIVLVGAILVVVPWQLGSNCSGHCSSECYTGYGT